VWSPVIVEAQPPGEGTAALGVGAVQPPISPLLEQDLVEPLDLAVGLRAVAAGPLELDPQPSGGLGEDNRLGIGLGVVGQDPLDPHPVVGEESNCLDQEPDRGGGRLVSQDLAEGDPGAVVDGRVDVVIAAAPTPRSGRAAAVGAVATTIRDAGVAPL
jgi:hypothetical protein